MNHAAIRAEAVLNHLHGYIGKGTPRNVDIAMALKTKPSHIDNTMTQLKDAGRIIVIGLGNARRIIIPGVGETISRSTAVSKGLLERSRGPGEVEQEPIRVHNWTCPRCGARSGNCAHTAISLTSSAIPAWRSI